MELRRALLSTAALLLLPIAGHAQQTQSTINPNVPAVGFLVEQSGPQFRSNWQSAINDINALFAGAGTGFNLPNTWTALQTFNGGALVLTRPPLDNTTNAASTAFVQAATGANANYLYATNFAGATAGDKIAACVTALAAIGGTCDARGIPSPGTIPGMTIADSGITILAPCGVFTVTGTILFNAGLSTNMDRPSVVGCGASVNTTGTLFSWGGPAGVPMFQLTGVRDAVFSDFGIQGNIAFPLFVGIGQSSQLFGGTTFSTNNAFRNIQITGASTNSLFMGMRWYGSGGNNDESTIDRVQVTNVMWAAYSIEAAQSKQHSFGDSGCVGLGQVAGNLVPTCIQTAFSNVSAVTLSAGGSGYTNGPLTVTVTGGTCLQQPQISGVVSGGVFGGPFTIPIPGACYTSPGNPVSTTPNSGGGTGATLNLTSSFGGSFIAYNMLGGNNSIDFYLGPPDDTIGIIGGVLENSNRFIVNTSGTSTTWPTNVYGMRWSANNIHPDNLMVIYKNKGGLNITGMTVDSTGANGAPQFSLQPTSFGAQATATGNAIFWGLASAGSQPFVTDAAGNGQWRLLGNTVLDGMGPTHTFAVGDAVGTPSFNATSAAGATATIFAGGTGGTPGAVTLTTVGGTCATHPTFTGTISAGGVLTSVSGVATAGTCTAPPANPTAVTGGGLAAATLNVYYTNPILPVCNANRNGWQLYVSDATGPTYHGAYVGGGAVFAGVVCINGTGWVTN